MKIGYFPGCSLHATARELDESLRAVAAPLDVELDEVTDWSCCGASSAHVTSHDLAVALAARNLSLAEAQGHARVMAPCAACYNRLATARHALAESPALRTRLGALFERRFEGTTEVTNLVGLLRELGPSLRAKVVRPLSGLKVACYYGCLLVRPAEIAGGDDPEAPTSMEDVVSALGATPVAWNRRLDCCGGSFSIARTDSVVRLGRAIVDDARAAGAQAIAVACPMCHSNLDLRQHAMVRRGEAAMPILYLTQLVGMALGLEPGPLGLGRHFVSTKAFVAALPAQKALAAAAPAAADDAANAGGH